MNLYVHDCGLGLENLYRKSQDRTPIGQSPSSYLTINMPRPWAYSAPPMNSPLPTPMHRQAWEGRKQETRHKTSCIYIFNYKVSAPMKSVKDLHVTVHCTVLVYVDGLGIKCGFLVSRREISLTRQLIPCGHKDAAPHHDHTHPFA